MRSYIEVAIELPVPTEEQAREFAEFVTGAHSWYKHLPVHPLSPFVFFLDPNAGRAMVHRPGGAVTFVDNTDDSDKFHYTWQTTESYRRRFGCWNYDARSGSSFKYQGKEGIVDTAGAGPNVLDPQSGWIEVPDPFVAAGTALVSALMYLGPAREHPDFRESEVRNSMQFFRGDTEDENRAADVRDLSRQLRRLWEDKTYVREESEAHRAPSELMDRDGRGTDGFHRVFYSDEYQRLKAEAKATWERTGSRQKEAVLMESLVAAIDRDRARQIDGMVDAMKRFIQTLHAWAGSDQT